MVENEETVMLTVRLPASKREALQSAVRINNITASDFVRGKIEDFLEQRIPNVRNRTKKEISEFFKFKALSYVKGNLPSTYISSNYQEMFDIEERSKGISLIRTIKEEFSISMDDPKDIVLINLAGDMDKMAHRLLLLEECMLKIQAAMEIE